MCGSSGSWSLKIRLSCLAPMPSHPGRCSPTWMCSWYVLCGALGLPEVGVIPWHFVNHDGEVSSPGL